LFSTVEFFMEGTLATPAMRVGTLAHVDPGGAARIACLEINRRCREAVCALLWQTSRMHVLTMTTADTKSANYAAMREQAAALFSGERDGLANAANLAALLFELLPDLNWAGFYFLREGELVLGPFQGKVACVRIALGRGVCGSAAATRKTLVVPDVHDFPGHIACDAASQSEIVVPLLREGRLFGVLDLDSPRRARFDADDAAGLEALADLLLAKSDFDGLVR
jgi:GAF domain-containing protein